MAERGWFRYCEAGSGGVRSCLAGMVSRGTARFVPSR